ncbi:hypothetical protein Tco_1337973 [Tanacetum coccineum]
MRELSIDYGPTPFRFFHYWFKLDGFDKMVEDTWKSLATIDSNGGSNEEILSDRSLLLKELNDINSIDSLEVAQKSKVRWAIEGDENTKFFHGVKAMSRMSNTSDKGTMFGDGAARVGMQLRSSPKVSTSSPLVSSSTIINVPRELYSIDVAATFVVPLTTVDRMETLETLGSICNSIKVHRNNADVIPCKGLYADDSINLNVDESTIPSEPIVQSVDINKSTSYAGVAGGSAKDQL